MGRSMPLDNFSVQNNDSLNEIQRLLFIFHIIYNISPNVLLIYCFTPVRYFPLVETSIKSRRGEIPPRGLFLPCSQQVAPLGFSSEPHPGVSN